MSNFIKVIFSLVVLPSLFSCTGLNSGYPSSGGYGGGYSDPYYPNNDYYAYRERERIRREQRELDEERDRLRRERDHIERQKRNRRPLPPVYSRVPAPKPKPERCPNGYYPSEQKCTKKERKHGCKDMRTPGGLGCKSK